MAALMQSCLMIYMIWSPRGGHNSKFWAVPQNSWKSVYWIDSRWCWILIKSIVLITWYIGLLVRNIGQSTLVPTLGRTLPYQCVDLRKKTWCPYSAADLWSYMRTSLNLARLVSLNIEKTSPIPIHPFWYSAASLLVAHWAFWISLPASPLNPIS